MHQVHEEAAGSDDRTLGWANTVSVEAATNSARGDFTLTNRR